MRNVGRIFVSALQVAVAMALPTGLSADEATTPQQAGWVAAGAGLDSCASYLSAMRTDQSGSGVAGKLFAKGEVYTQWILGFVSAIDDLHLPGVEVTRIDPNGMTAWVESYCASSPQRRIIDAAAAFVRTGQTAPQ
jgi:hypothetical protein